eukprot:7124091-Alexandrium_andersonii.AAC.1
MHEARDEGLAKLGSPVPKPIFKRPATANVDPADTKKPKKKGGKSSEEATPNTAEPELEEAKPVE